MENCVKDCGCNKAQSQGGGGIWKDKKFRWLLIAIATIIPFEIMSFYSVHFPLWAELPFFAVFIFVFGRKVFASGLKSISRLNFSNINFLMTVAVIGAIYLQQFEEAVIIVILFSLGEMLEDFGIKKSRNALEKLVGSSPKSAQVKGKENKTPIEKIEVGAIIIVKPGDQIPLDGEVVMGNSLVDEAVITGEPLPKNKYVGDKVYAGTQNNGGYLEIKVTKKSKDTTLAKIIELTYQSAEKKSKSQKFIEKFAQYYTPSVLVISVLLVIVPVLIFHKPFNVWLTQALTLLIISCPCALVMSTPVAVFSAIGNATKRGALIKGARFLEELGKIRAIAFDKTRTLTEGNPYVSDIIPYNGFTENELLACAGGLEIFSEHPIAKSIVDKAKENKVDIHHFNDFQSVQGKGVKGACTFCADANHCLGNLTFIQDESSGKAEKYMTEKIRELEKQGKTAMIISDSKQIKGIFGVSDKIRNESVSVVDEIKRLGIKTYMLTGDNENTAQFVGKQLGIDEVQAGLLPENKAEKIDEYANRDKYVAMVGDGINDAPALAKSTVGIALGAVGSDLAIENADIALMNNDLALIPYLIRLGRKCASKIRFNVILAVGIKALFILLAFSGISSLALAIFADVGVTIIVILNSLRLYKFEQS